MTKRPIAPCCDELTQAIEAGTHFLTVNTIAIIGANTTGPAFARAAALAGYPTILEDISREMLERGMAWISDSLQDSVVRGKFPNATRLAALSRVSAASTVESAIREADLIIEAVPEEFEMKLELFTVFDKFAKPGAIFASTTSTLSILDISDVTICRERCVGMRFRELPGGGARKFDCMELVRTRLTSDETMRACTEVAERLAKEFVLVADIAAA
jgi:3-hydroxyacyl-CoA dehydrogenase